jgi:4a-hydroxytetrahydrobiopterin dehydratase
VPLPTRRRLVSRSPAARIRGRRHSLSQPVEQYAGESIDDGQVGCEPIDVVQFVDGQPPQRAVLEGCRLAVNDAREPHAQHTVLADRPVAAHPRAEHHVNAEFFETFADQGCFVGLARVDFAARQLPPAGQGGWSRPLRRKQPISVDDGRADDNLRADTHGSGVYVGQMPQVLTSEQLATALKELHGWEGDASGITRSVRAPSFVAAIRLVDAVAEVAESLDHHPDIDIRWTTIKFACSTHSKGGVTDLDVTLARRIDELASAMDQA